MKKSFRRAAALIGAVLLFGMYGMTLAASFLDRSAGQAWLKASVTATILIPVLLYAILLVERGLREWADNKQESEKLEKKKK